MLLRTIVRARKDEIDLALLDLFSGYHWDGCIFCFYTRYNTCNHLAIFGSYITTLRRSPSGKSGLNRNSAFIRDCCTRRPWRHLSGIFTLRLRYRDELISWPQTHESPKGTHSHLLKPHPWYDLPHPKKKKKKDKLGSLARYYRLCIRSVNIFSYKFSACIRRWSKKTNLKLSLIPNRLLPWGRSDPKDIPRATTTTTQIKTKVK